MNFNRFTIAATSTGPIEKVSDSCLKIPVQIQNYKQDPSNFDIFFTNPKRFDFVRKFIRAGFEGLYDGRISVREGRIGLIAQNVEMIKWAPKDAQPPQQKENTDSIDNDDIPF